MMETGQFSLSKSLQLTSPSEFGGFVVRQFAGEKVHAIVYLESAMRSIKGDGAEKEIPIDAIDETIESIEMTDLSSIAAVNENFLSDKSNFVLNYGKKEVFMAGLESYIGRPKNPDILGSMENEHNKFDNSSVEFRPPNNPELLTTPAEEWLFVINPVAYIAQAKIKKRVILNRKVVTVDELMCNEISTKAQLTVAEVVAGRLYTGPMFKLYNDILGNPQGPGRQNFIYTIHAFASCIVKLSRVHQITTLYRGIKGGALSNTFLNVDEHGARGGVEFGFMSTTTNKHVAYDYAIGRDGSTKRAALIYEIDEGAIDRGADVSWLLQFPSENEVVFPPLSNLQVFGNPKVVDGAIITKLRVNINLRTRTVDEIVDKSRTQFKDMLEWYFDEVKTVDLGDCRPDIFFPSWLVDFTDFKDKMLEEDATRFNQHKFYRKAVDDSLDLREGTVQKVHLLHLLSKLDLDRNIHDIVAFQEMVERLRATHSSAFADPNFVRRYADVKDNCYDRDGNISIENYQLLWKLPLQQGSWAQMTRASSAVKPVKVTTYRTYGQVVRDFTFWIGYGFWKGLCRQLIGYESVDKLLGFDGMYYYVGRSADSGKPFYQLSRKESSLSCKYLYFKNNRWYIGSSMGSESADVQSISEGDAAPTDVIRWARTRTPLLLAYMYSSDSYVPENDTKVRTADVVVGSQVMEDEESACTNPIWNGRAMSIAGSNVWDVGERWAFVHRLEEQNMSPPCCSSTESQRSQSSAAHSIQLGTPELHSIAVFCEQMKCPLPKEVGRCLRREGTNAALAASLLVASILLSLLTIGIPLALLGITDVSSIRIFNIENLTWYLLGRSNSCFIIALGCVACDSYKPNISMHWLCLPAYLFCICRSSACVHRVESMEPTVWPGYYSIWHYWFRLYSDIFHRLSFLF